MSKTVCISNNVVTKILLIANEYVKSTVIDMLNTILPYDIEQIIVLKENQGTEVNTKCKYDVLICCNLEEAIHKCDIVIWFKTDKCNPLLEKKIMSSCNSSKKKYVIIDNTSGYLLNTENTFKYANENYSKSSVVPTVLLLSLGRFNQHFRLEFILSDIFKELGANYKVEYSNEYVNLLRQLTDHDCNTDEGQNCAVIIQSIIQNEIDDLLYNKHILEYFENLKPDFLIINFEGGISETCDISTILEKFKIRYNVNIDFVSCSNYCCVKDSNNSFIPVLYESDLFKGVYSLEDENFKRILLRKIVEKLAFPKNIIIV